MSNLVRLGVEYFPKDDKGKPVGGGSIYVGNIDTDPEVIGNQKQVKALQEDGSFVNMTQPIALSAGGIPLYNGSPVSLYVNGDYSLKVLDAQGGQVYHIPSYYDLEDSPLAPGNYYYPEYAEADQGVVGNDNTIKYYVDYIGSDEATLYFRHNSGSQWTDYTLLTAETIPNNIKLEFESGARIDIDSGITFTVNGSIKAGPQHIFDGDGSVAFTNAVLSEVLANWFGFDEDASGTNNATYLENAVKAAVGRKLCILDGTYIVDSATFTNEVHLCLTDGATIQQMNDGTGSLLIFSPGSDNSSVRGGTIDGNKANQAVIKNAIAIACDDMVIENVKFEDVSLYAINAGITSGGMRVQDCRFMNVDGISIYICPGTADITKPVIVRGNYVDSVAGGVAANAGIFLDHDVNDDPRIYSAEVSNNTVLKAQNGSSVYEPIVTRCAGYLRVTGNHFVGGSQCTFTYANDTVIDGNIFEGQAYYVIELGEGGRTVISNNVIDGKSICVDGIRITSLNDEQPDLIITGNQIKGCTSTCVYTRDEIGIVLSNNVFEDQQVILYGIVGGVISSNRFHNNTIGLTTYQNTRSGRSLSITGNNFYKCSTSGLHFASSPIYTLQHITVIGNTFEDCGNAIYFTDNSGSINNMVIADNIFHNNTYAINSSGFDQIPVTLCFTGNIGAEHVVYLSSPDSQNHRINWAEHIQLDGASGSDIGYVYDAYAVIGQRRYFNMTDATNNMTVLVITHSTGSDVVFTFNATTDYLVLEWMGNHWRTVVSNGV